MAQETKHQLRIRLKAGRQKLSVEDVKGLSSAAATRCLETINWKGIRHINVYSAIGKLRELDPEPLVTALKNGLPYLKITVQPNSSSIKQPKKTPLYDAVIVPVLGFDKHGHRLGYGGGFYDKFLAAQPQALKIGICYEQGLIKTHLPTEKHDVPMDIIITEGIIIKRDSHPGKNR